MSVRMSTSQMFSRALNPMLDVQRQVSKTQEQISTNKRVLTPADDPIAATRILQLNQELAGLNQYNNSLSTLGNRLEREDTALDAINQLMQKAQELVTQSGNAAINREQRGYIAVELQSVIDAMAQQMNARDAGGEFIFSGYKGTTQPFVKGSDGRYSYQGDEGQRFMQAGPVTRIAANDSGFKVFMDVPSASPTVSVSASAANRAEPPAIIGRQVIRDADAFAAFFPENAVIEFNANNAINPPGLNYTVRQVSDGRVLDENVAYTPGNEIQFAGISVRIEGRPVEGDSFTVASTNRKGVLEGLEDYVTELQRLTDSGPDRERLSTALGNTLDNLSNAQNQLIKTRAAVGARMNQVDAARESNQDFELVVRTALSELSDLDYAKAISQLTQETFVLEAAQASFTKVTRLSLFNLI